MGSDSKLALRSAYPQLTPQRKARHGVKKILHRSLAKGLTPAIEILTTISSSSHFAALPEFGVLSPI